MLIILLTRAPVPGQTKTRLQSHLTGEECACLHQAFLKDMVATVKSSGASLVVAYTPLSGKGMIQTIIGDSVELLPQEGIDLGEKMLHCLKWGLERGYSKVCLMGTDIPTLRPSYLQEAKELLDSSDVVLGPTLDGGYCFIGMNQCIPQVFTGMEWGHKSVLDSTMAVLRENNCQWTLLPALRDIDVWEDLLNLYCELKEQADLGEAFPHHTYAALKKLGRFSLIEA